MLSDVEASSRPRSLPGTYVTHTKFIISTIRAEGWKSLACYVGEKGKQVASTLRRTEQQTK
jgi:hypothetical protein